MKRVVVAFLLFAVLTGSAWAQTASKKATVSKKPAAQAATAQVDLPSRATVEGFLRETFGYEPTLKYQVVSIKPSQMPGVAEVTVSFGDGSQVAQLLVMPGGQYAIAGNVDLIPFGADPFARARTTLAAEAKGPARGPANAPVTIVEFSDLQCPHCKQGQPVIDRLVAELPNTRLVFEPFPIESIHKWALMAARYADCVHAQKPDAFWRFIQSVYDAQADITEANVVERMGGIAGASGADAGKAAECAAAPESLAHVHSAEELGRSLGVNSTPTVFINGRRVVAISDIPFEQLKAMVEYASKKTAH